MHVLNVSDVNAALPAGLHYLRDHGQPGTSRNGPVRVAPGPVATVYAQPAGRVLFDAQRDINPFFHLFEALWIIEGRSDVAFLSLFNSKMVDYSDNGTDFHAPYGYRLRVHFNVDQIDAAVNMLRKNPQDRRVVLQIWDAASDLDVESKDLPCNDMIFLRVQPDNRLDLTVANRSNDVVWGAYGTNVVQFSILQEYIAAMAGLDVGTYTQISHNYHVYTDLPFWKSWLAESYVPGPAPMNPYMMPIELGGCVPTRLFEKQANDTAPPSARDVQKLFEVFDTEYEESHPYDWVDELRSGWSGISSHVFTTVVLPMLYAWQQHKRGQTADALTYLGTFDQSCDWIRCSTDWLRRRVEKQNAA